MRRPLPGPRAITAPPPPRPALLLAVALLAAPAAARAQAVGGHVMRVPVTGVVELGLAPFVERAVRTAESEGARAVILDIDTPGGRIDAAERIADALQDSRVPVYAYVNRRAFSAGALIALAADHIYMRPGSVIGAATPVDGGGTKASEKIVSAMRSEMRALAEARGLDPRIAEAMVDESLAVPGVVEEGRLLTLTTEEAVAVGYADVVEDLPDLLERVDLAGVEVRDLEVNWAERIVRFLSHPTVAPFLLSIGFLGLLVEIKTPTFGLSGALGVLALSLFFGSHLILGLAGWEDLLLFGLGLVLLAAEVFVVPGFGLLGILGISGILAGLYLSLLGSFPTMTDIATAGGVLSTTLLLILLAGWALLKYLPRSGRLHRSGVFLDAATARETGYESARARKDLVGREGRAITDLRPSGVGLFGDERVDIVSEAEWIEEGTPVRIISAEGYRHVVRPIERVALDAGDGGRAAAAKSRTGEPPAPTAAADTDTDTDAPAAERPASGESELPPSEDDDR